MLASAGLKKTGTFRSSESILLAAPLLLLAHGRHCIITLVLGEQYMSKKLYVGNLPWSMTEDEVRAAFQTYGEVNSVNLIEDRETGRPRGFGFVEMGDSDAQEAIDNLDGKDFGGRNIKVNEARPRVERPRW
jgi:RNA recognition motif-containing protein